MNERMEKRLAALRYGLELAEELNNGWHPNHLGRENKAYIEPMAGYLSHNPMKIDYTVVSTLVNGTAGKMIVHQVEFKSDELAQSWCKEMRDKGMMKDFFGVYPHGVESTKDTAITDVRT
jgi:hypothetical protein